MERKRRHKRVIKRLETEFSADGLTFRGISSDLSRSGLFIRTSKPFPADTVVDLTIHLPGDLVSNLKGSVRRVVKTGQAAIKNGMGMEIVEVDRNYEEFLNTILPADEPPHIPKPKDPAAGPVLKRTSAAPQKTAGDPKEDVIDSMISALFSKRDDN